MINKNSKINKIILRFALSFCFLIFTFLIFTTKPAHAATLYFSPSSGNFTVGNLVTTSVYVNTQGKEINNSDVVIHFPTDYLEVVSVSRSGSVFSLWVEEPAFSNSAGTISFNGGLPTPGFNGASGKIIGIVFRAKSAGSATVVISSGAVRANDGFGTDVLQSRGQAQFNLVGVVPPRETPPAEAPVKPPVEPPVENANTPLAPIINSITHPDPNKWYASNVPEFSWVVPAGVNASQILVGRVSNSVPTVIYSPPINNRKLDELEDGIWYFHVRLRNASGWGGVTHRQFLIDTVPPDPFSIEIDNGGDATNPSPLLRFVANDKTSGVAYYEIQIGSSEDVIRRTPKELTNNTYQLPAQAPGKYTILIKAVDGANNFSLASTVVTIEPIEPPVIIEIPSTLEIDDSLIVKGETIYANSTVVVVVKKEGEEQQSLEVTADAEGNWTYIHPSSLKKGTYQVWAYVIDARGSQSESSPKATLAVILTPFLQFGEIAITYLSVLISLIALVALLVILGFYTWYWLAIWRRRVREETREVSRMVNLAFKDLTEEVEKQIEYLDGKPGLTRNEERVRDQLKKSLENSKKTISKGIKDIENKIK